jgi:hypothetical protein
MGFSSELRLASGLQGLRAGEEMINKCLPSFGATGFSVAFYQERAEKSFISAYTLWGLGVQRASRTCDFDTVCVEFHLALL